MIKPAITDSPIISIEPLKKTFLAYLFIIVLLESVWVLLDFMAIAAAHDTSKDFSQIVVVVKLFSLGLIVSGIMATVFATPIFSPLSRKINTEYEIHTPGSILVAADIPYSLFNACIIVNLLLTVVTNKLCPFINLGEIGESLFFLSMDCTTLVKQTRSFLLGAGAGLSLGALIWAQKKELTTYSPILVNFHWTKTVSTEYLIFVAIILLYIFFGNFLPLLFNMI